MNRLALLSLTAVMAAYGTMTMPADPPVNLQATTPGIAQNGHINVSGQVIGRNFYASTSATSAYVGLANATTGTASGGDFYSAANNGRGVSGTASSGTGFNYGGYFQSGSDNGKGVFGLASNAGGTTYGVHGRSASSAGRGVFGEATSTGGTNYGVYGRSTSATGRGIFGEATGGGLNYGGLFQTVSNSGYGVLAKNTGGGVAIRAESNGLALQVLGLSSFSNTVSFGGGLPFTVAGPTLVPNLNADKLDGLDASAFLQTVPVPLTLNTNSFSTTLIVGNGYSHGQAIRATSPGGNGVYGESTNDSGVYGVGAYGLEGRSFQANGEGVHGWCQDLTSVCYGVRGGTNSPTNGFGVFSLGNMGASGTKPFRIDHPLDPTNKYLFHYSTESPEPQNFYNGNVTTDSHGEAWVELPAYFEEINRDFRYTLTVVDDTDSEVFVMAKVAKKIRDNRFKIRTNAPNVQVSWRVDALRNDPWVRKYGAETERDKQGIEKGTYQHPELYGQPAEKGLDYRLEHRTAKVDDPSKK